MRSDRRALRNVDSPTLCAAVVHDRLERVIIGHNPANRARCPVATSCGRLATQPQHSVSSGASHDFHVPRTAQHWRMRRSSAGCAAAASCRVDPMRTSVRTRPRNGSLDPRGARGIGTLHWHAVVTRTAKSTMRSRGEQDLPTISESPERSDVTTPSRTSAEPEQRRPTVSIARDLQLITRLHGRDAEAEHQFVARLTPGIRRFFERARMDADDADDCVQLTLLRAFRSMATFRAESALSTWLFGIAHHVLLDHRRAVARRQRLGAALASEIGPGMSTHASPAKDPMVAHRLYRALASLQPRERATLLLYAAGFTHREIGCALNVAAGSSKSLLHRARRRIRPLLDPYSDVAVRQA